MKFLTGFLLCAALLCAADKRYSVCLVAGPDEQCTKPLTKDVSDAVFDVFSKAPIGGLDAVYVYDTKAKHKKGQHGVIVTPAHPIPDPGANITLTPGETKL